MWGVGVAPDGVMFGTCVAVGLWGFAPTGALATTVKAIVCPSQQVWVHTGTCAKYPDVQSASVGRGALVGVTPFTPLRIGEPFAKLPVVRQTVLLPPLLPANVHLERLIFWL